MFFVPHAPTPNTVHGRNGGSSISIYGRFRTGTAGAADAPRLAEAGVDGIQVDKLSVEETARLVGEIRAINPAITLVAAGGVNLTNAKDYAATGVDGLATTCLHFAKPLDMSVRMECVS